MKPENAIEVNNVTKKFKVYLDKGHTLKERTLFSKRRAFENRNVLNGISFEVKKGEAIGLIGHNGCGKSTTLKLLTRIMYPDSGTVEMRGRVSSLIELGAGFHPDMSGRENIYTNASIFGLTKKEIEERVDDIIAFSELEKYIDNPVRTYSSGMYMRLAFAVAINVDADILLIDEILAVGDVAFQAKCFNRLREIKAAGTTIVIVSHALSQMEQICDRSIWIHEGKIKAEGPPRLVDPKYMAFMSESSGLSQMQESTIEGTAGGDGKNGTVGGDAKNGLAADGDGKNGKVSGESGDIDSESNESGTDTSKRVVEDGKRWGSGEAIMTKVTAVDFAGDERHTFSNEEPITLHIEYETTREVSDAVIGIAIYRSDETYIYGTNTLIDTNEPTVLGSKGYIDMKIERMPLCQGDYSIDLAFHRPDGFNYDFWREVVKLKITNPVNEVGIISLQHSWDVQ